MGHFSAGELIIIAVLVIVIFGGRKLPELGRGLGQGLANFRRAVQDPSGNASSAKKDEAAPGEASSSSEEKDPGRKES